MRANIKNKIRSPRGASITFALMLFLVCALVSSVVIVAGTAASGRMSTIAETDQRYYAVNSATEMLKGLLDNKTSVVTRETMTQTTIVYYDDPSAGDARVPQPTATPTAPPSGVPISNTATIVTETVNGPYLLNPETYDVEATIGEVQLNSIERDILARAAYYLTKDPAVGYKKAFTLEMYVPSGVTLGDDMKKVQDAVKVDVYEDVSTEADGEIRFYVRRAKGKTRVVDRDVDLAYTLKLLFVPDRQQVTDTIVEYSAPVKTGGYKDVEVALGDGSTRLVKCPLYAITETSVETVTTTFTWELIGITKEPVPDDLLSLGGGVT